MKFRNNRFFFLIIPSLILGVIGFLIWLRFFCSDCQAAEKNLTSRILNPRAQIESAAPEVVFKPSNSTLKDLSGKGIALDDFKGENVLLVFWATYCGWCAKEKDDLKRFTDEQKGRIEVIAIVEEPWQVVWDYVEKEKINFMILLDEKRTTFEKYRVLGTPHHLLINSEGEIVVNRPGYASYNDLLMLTQALND